MNKETNIVAPEKLFELAKTAKKTIRKKGKISTLTPHLSTIQYLRRSKHFSYRNIHSFFNDSGVKCSYQNLMLFVRKNKIGAKRSKKTKS